MTYLKYDSNLPWANVNPENPWDILTSLIIVIWIGNTNSISSKSNETSISAVTTVCYMLMKLQYLVLHIHVRTLTGIMVDNLRPTYIQSGVVMARFYLSGVPDLWDHNKIIRGGDLSHLHVPNCIWVFFYFDWFVFIHHNYQFYVELWNYCNILDFYLL